MAIETIKSGGVSIDTTDFAKFAKALRKAAPEMAKSLRTEMRAAGEIVAAEARSRAAGASKTIPGSIKVRVSGATVSIVAGGANVPLAGLMELGNKGGGGGGQFKHPVWGNRNVWVSQPMHPFLAPALAAKADVAEQAAVNALDKAIAIVVSEG